MKRLLLVVSCLLVMPWAAAMQQQRAQQRDLTTRAANMNASLTLEIARYRNLPVRAQREEQEFFWQKVEALREGFVLLHEQAATDQQIDNDGLTAEVVQLKELNAELQANIARLEKALAKYRKAKAKKKVKTATIATQTEEEVVVPAAAAKVEEKQPAAAPVVVAAPKAEAPKAEENKQGAGAGDNKQEATSPSTENKNTSTFKKTVKKYALVAGICVVIVAMVVVKLKMQRH